MWLFLLWEIIERRTLESVQRMGMGSFRWILGKGYGMAGYMGIGLDNSGAGFMTCKTTRLMFIVPKEG